MLDKMKFKKFEDGHHWPISEALEVAAHKGLHPGKYFEGWMRDRLAEKGITKFGQLHDETGPGDGVQYRLQVIARPPG